MAKHRDGEYIEFRGKLPLTAILAVGSRFLEVGGYSFRAEQPTRGEINLWRSDAKPSQRDFVIREREISLEGKDILVVFSITGDASDDADVLSTNIPESLRAVIYAEPDNAPGDGAIESDSDATALAIRGKEIIRSSRLKYRSLRTHLVLYAPATFCLFLGQRLNALGEIVTYERTADGGYQPSVILRTS